MTNVHNELLSIVFLIDMFCIKHNCHITIWQLGLGGMFQCFTRSIGAHDPAHHQTAHNQWLNKIYQNVRLQRHILLWATSNKPVIMQLCFSKRQYSLYMTNSTKFVNRPIEWHAPITIISYLEEQSMTFSIYKYNTITHKLPCRLYLLKSELPPTYSIWLLLS